MGIMMCPSGLESILCSEQQRQHIATS